MTTPSTPDADLPHYTITEAAKRLGISREALRLRVRRGRVLASKSNGQWYVHLPAEGADTDPDRSPDQTPDLDQGAIVTTLREDLEHARDEITRLWAALEVRDRELERKDAIIMALAQRPALPSPADQPEPGATVPRDEPESAVARRSWFWRLLGTVRLFAHGGT